MPLHLVAGTAVVEVGRCACGEELKASVPSLAFGRPVMGADDGTELKRARWLVDLVAAVLPKGPSSSWRGATPPVKLEALLSPGEHGIGIDVALVGTACRVPNLEPMVWRLRREPE
jgi:hypothetical protein